MKTSKQLIQLGRVDLCTKIGDIVRRTATFHGVPEAYDLNDITKVSELFKFLIQEACNCAIEVRAERESPPPPLFLT